MDASIRNGDDRVGATGARRRWAARGGRVLAGTAVALSAVVATAAPAVSAECTIGLVFLRLCGPATAAPPPVTTPPTTAAPLQPVVLPPTTLPPVLAPPTAPVSAADAARRMLDLVNGERRSAGLGQLSTRDDITAVALAHSERMAQSGNIFHSDTYFGTAIKSLLGAGARGENVAVNVDVNDAHARLMGSPGHRANILDSRFSVVGIAVVRDASGRIFITQNFMQPSGAPRSVAPPASRSAAPARPAARPAAAAPTPPAPAAPTTVPVTAPVTASTVPVAAPSSAVVHDLDAHIAASVQRPPPAGEVSGPTTGLAVVLLVLALSACWVVPRRLPG